MNGRDGDSPPRARGVAERSHTNWARSLWTAARDMATGRPIRGGSRTQRGSRATRGGSASRTPLAAFARYNRAYFQRWIFVGTAIGVASGITMTLFVDAIAFCTNILLGLIAGDYPPSPVGEGPTVLMHIARPWLIPVVTTLGGLLTGLIVYTLAPETAGGGTDSSIQAFHQDGARIRRRVPGVKLIASSITIGSGLSAGREGAAAQIMAGVGAWFADVLNLDEHDRRIALVVGIGSGIGTVFRAPFAGALFAAEVLYKRDFEADALFPTFIASVIGYAIYGAFTGWTPIFGLHTGKGFTFGDPRSLVAYLILGVCSGLLGLLFHYMMHQGHTLFARINMPRILKPALGGLLVGLIGIFLPYSLTMGYGYVQFGVDNNYAAIGAITLGILVFAKIVTTALTLGSGNSGGDVAPAIVIGGFLGGALWALLHTFAPVLVLGIAPGAFVIVGMGAFFGGISKTPLAMILMVAEMTGQLSLVVPAMLATMIAYILTGDTTIYEEQLPSRLDSPAHKDDYVLPLLQNLKVSDAMTTGVDGAIAAATPDTSLAAVDRYIRERRVMSVPVIDGGRLVGVVTPTDLMRVSPNDIASGIAKVRQVMSRAVVRATPDESLYAAWLRMSRRGLRQLAVVDRQNPTQLVGMVTADAIGQLLRPPRASAGSREERVREDTSPGVSQRRPVDPAWAAAQQERQEREDNRSASGKMPVPPRSATTRPHEGSASGPVADRAMDRLSRTSAQEDPLARMSVADAMSTTPPAVQDSEPLSSVRAALQRSHSVLVLDGEGILCGIITRRDIANRQEEEGGRSLTAGDIAVRNLVTTTPRESLRSAVRRMTRLSVRQLPVLDGSQPAAPVGLLRRSDVLAAYGRALAENLGEAPGDDEEPSAEKMVTTPPPAQEA